MTNHVVRLYALVATLAVFFVSWAVIAAHPWRAEAAATSDPRLVQLANREVRLRHEAARVNRIVAHRWAVYHRRLERRKAQNAEIVIQNQQAASAPVQVVTLPAQSAPVTSTRTS